MRTARLGPLHPDTLWSMNGVATMYVRAGKTSEAVRLYESALSRMKTEQGYMHRETDMVLNNLASAYQDQGRAFEAAALYEDALRTARAVQTNNPSRYLRWLARRCELLVASNTTNAAAGALEEFDRLSDPLSREASSDQQVQVLRLRGRLRARCGRLAEAAADLSKVVALDPKGHWDWFQLAPLLLESGDTAGYRKHCVGMLARFGTETDLILAERTAKVCLLMQPETSVASEVYALADRIAGVNPEHSAYGFFQIAKALADYRRGQFVGAVDSAGRALAKPRSAYRDIQGYAITAMATFQLHRDEEARVALAKAVEIAEQNLPEENSQNLGDSWQDALMCRSILREARNLIERTAKPVGSAP